MQGTLLEPQIQLLLAEILVYRRQGQDAEGQGPPRVLGYSHLFGMEITSALYLWLPVAFE